VAIESSESFVRKLLRPVAQLREGETATVLLMFAYSFLAMTSYNIIQPVTRSRFISDLGAENLPYIQFAAGVLIGLIMQGYMKATSLLPRRWVIPVSQAGLAAILVGFWLLFQTEQEWVSAAFYLLGLIFAILLVSQFWTLANAIYDPRQAKRIFGFIGGGTTLGGMTGAAITTFIAEPLGTNALILFSAGFMVVCIGIVVWVLRREGHVIVGAGVEEEKGVGAREALELFVSSRQTQLIAVIISFGALGAVILDQQLNMATEEFKGRGQTDAITAFLGAVRFYVSAAGLVIQVFLTSRIHRFLGIGFALLVLPVNLAAMAGIILGNAALWAPSLGSVVDRSFRYTVDKTTREILFLPLPTDVKLQAKPFIDVTVDRLAKGIGALILLVLIKPWGLNLSWQQLSYVTLTLVAIWVVAAVRAKREYVRAFRRTLEQQQLQPSEIRIDNADLNTVETLIVELGHEDPARVVYAIDLLESLDKRHLVSPLLLDHRSPVVRRRALLAVANAAAQGAGQWAAGAERALTDPDPDVRLAAVRAVAALRSEHAAELMRPYLTDSDPRLAVTAAVALVSAGTEQDRVAAETTLRSLASDSREQARDARLEVARGLGQLSDPRFQSLLVPLMFDADLDVAHAAIHSAGKTGPGDFLFVPPLISLLRHRLLKGSARAVLVGYGEGVIDSLAYFLNDKDEDKWIRRHIPSTLALIQSQRALDVLVGALDHEDGFIRYKAVAGIERLRRDRPDLQLDAAVVERQILREAARAFNALTLHYNLFVAGGLDADALLARALTEKHTRAMNRVFQLLGLIHPPDDVAAVRATLGQSDGRLRSGAIEYLDNLLKGEVRRRVLMLIEEMPVSERVRRGNTLFKTRVRDVEDTLAQLVHDEQATISAAAIHVIERQEIWTLADDVEYVLAHRDPRDWAVFEAASWALAARRLSAERRRALWLEPLPAVELADRFRRMHLFGFASVDELFRIAALGRQVRYDGGQALYERGRTATSLQVLLDGRVTIETASPRTVDAPAVLAFDNVLEGTPVEARVSATGTAICLLLSSDEFLSLLSENVEIAEGLFRLLVETGSSPEVMHAQAASSPESYGGELQAVDLVRVLKASPLLSRATTGQLLTLATIARRVALTPGVDPRAGLPPAMIVVLSGSARVSQDGQAPVIAAAGDVIGVATALGGRAASRRVEALGSGMAIYFTRTELFEVLADHIDLLQAIYSGLLKAQSHAGESLPV
jgi:ATP/ADP translocase/HEAT repeat protein/CRP-like cAMP-binding protein